ncbi:GDP/UDP-N,N'-diacetylbacillosamine 2-epimerase (hydrolyzing) [Desulfuromonas sp. DDH964]|uniref:UDP-N-acetylglucosamine 2-epimerase n=1 Tax=Desulfuromonas sp. DDH964 TaxID=1823759 RepID=UPI00078C179E|nr:UDP-N-acetylglucosamine 2-epimerase [Desulfuromonas sp. DDH964]AMV71853.1 GDP/UDP-N,N'-diacetylbacillosamine 2-epimerase (hydrolyzing) [Desulfuromonas sp. DDH964]
MRKICIVTGTRAEYGLLYWLMKEVEADPGLQLQLIVTGMHLSPEFGLTYRTIEEDGFTIDARVEMLLSSDTPVGIAKSIGLGVIGFADALERLKPDMMVVLGDRYEILAAVQAALVARIPVAHIHGGETTEGAIDESIRHAITKMSHLHFVAAEPYRKRVIQLGEHPDTVFDVGALGIENIRRLQLLDKAALEQSINFELGTSFFLGTYHPATLGALTPQAAMQALLDALDKFPQARIIFTKPNSDTDGRILGRMIDDYAQQHHERVAVFTSMGQVRYLSALKLAAAVIGNSSSGIIEAPACHIPTVNIGDRQSGRLKADSIIDCLETKESIAAAINKALSPRFRDEIKHGVSPYGYGETASQIRDCLKSATLSCAKPFYDLREAR